MVDQIEPWIFYANWHQCVKERSNQGATLWLLLFGAPEKQEKKKKGKMSTRQIKHINHLQYVKIHQPSTSNLQTSKDTKFYVKAPCFMIKMVHHSFRKWKFKFSKILKAYVSLIYLDMKRGQQKIKFGTNIPKPNAPGSLQINLWWWSRRWTYYL